MRALKAAAESAAVLEAAAAELSAADVEQAVATSASVVAAELAWCETSLEKMRKAARHWKKQYDTLKEAKA